MKKIKIFSKGSAGLLVLAIILSANVPVAHAGLFSFLNKSKGVAATVGTDGRVEIATANEACNAPIYAQVVFSRNPAVNFGVRNWGSGDLARRIYVGGSGDTNKYTSGDWFKLYDGQNFIVDSSSDAYEDVKGLAVQRGPGFVRLVLHGSWTEPDNNPLMHRERAEASIRFSTDMRKQSMMIVPVSVVSDMDPQNAIEPTGTYASSQNTNHPQNDKIGIANNQSFFKFVVSNNDDGYYTYYENVNPACK